MTNFSELKATPLPIIATVTRLVSKITDRISGDRSEFPLLVACVTAETIRHYGINAHIFYGPAAWVEVMEDMSVLWAGCWGENHHFWVATQYGEIVDLNVSVSHRKRAHSNNEHRPKYSPPMLWAREVPKFYRYQPEGLAEVELDSDRDQRWFNMCLSEVIEKAPSFSELEKIPLDQLDFPEEPILTPDRRILDDGAKSFQHYDRALMVQGIPPSPF